LPLILQDRWSPEDALRLIGSFRCSYAVAAPTFLSDLIGPARRTRADVSSLRLFATGGAPVREELVGAAADLGITALRLYGSTETLVATCNRPSAPAAARRATDGRPLPHVELEVRTESGESLVGAPGEIFVRSPANSLGFLGDPARTAEVFDPEGWVRTGDIGVLDAAGYLTVVGRRRRSSSAVA